MSLLHCAAARNFGYPMSISSRVAIILSIIVVVIGGLAIYFPATTVADEIDVALNQEDENLAAAMMARLLSDAEQDASALAYLIEAQPNGRLSDSSGQSIQKALDVNAALVADANGRIISAAVSIETSLALGRTKAVRDVALYAARPDGPRKYSGFLYSYGQTFVASAVRIDLVSGEPVVAIVLSRVSSDMLRDLAYEFGLAGLQFHLNSQRNDNELALSDIRGERMGYLAWERQSPMRQMIARLVPRVVTAIVGVAIIIAALILFALRSLRRAATATLQREIVVKSEKAKSMFFANLSHEFRTPLNAIIGFSEVMKMKMYGPVGNPKYEEYISDVYSSATHLLGLIEDVLSLSQYQADEVADLNNPVDLDVAIKDTVRMLSGKASQKEIHVDFDGDQGRIVYASEKSVRQILLNIVGNAIKYTHGGKVEIRQYDGAVDGTVCIRVSDTGIGIPRHEIPRILKPFEQMDDVYARSQGGTGLGLSIVGAILAKCGGDLVVDSDVGIGTVVTVVLKGSKKIRNTVEECEKEAA